MSKVIITGANGQVGSYMAEYLLKDKSNTLILTTRRTSKPNLKNLSEVADNPRVSFATMDLNDPYSIQHIIKSEKPDYFLNFGAATFVADSWNSPALYMQTNATSLIHILEAVKDFAPLCRVYSSGSTDQINPKSIYGVAKNAASLICEVYKKSYNLYVVQGIPSNHESIRRAESFLSRKVTKGAARIYRQIQRNKKFEPILLGNIEHTRRDWSHVKDFVDGIWLMMNQEKYRADMKNLLFNNSAEQQKFYAKNIKNYLLSSNKTHSIKDLVSIVFEFVTSGCRWIGSGENTKLVDRNGTVLVAVDKKFYRPSEVEPPVDDSMPIRNELGWQPKYTFEELMREMIGFDIEEEMNPK